MENKPVTVDKEAIKGWLINYCDGKFPGDFTVNEVVSILESYSSNLLKENEELKENWKMTEEDYQDDAIKWINERAKLEKEVEYWKARCEAIENVLEMSQKCGHGKLEVYGVGTEEWLENYNKWQALKQQPIK